MQPFSEFPSMVAREKLDCITKHQNGILKAYINISKKRKKKNNYIK
jgi:hypothetical protein